MRVLTFVCGALLVPFASCQGAAMSDTVAPSTGNPSTGRPTTGIPDVTDSTGRPTTGTPTTGIPGTFAPIPPTVEPSTGMPTTGLPTTALPGVPGATGFPTTGQPTTGIPNTLSPDLIPPPTPFPDFRQESTPAPRTPTPPGFGPASDSGFTLGLVEWILIVAGVLLLCGVFAFCVRWGTQKRNNPNLAELPASTIDAFDKHEEQLRSYYHRFPKYESERAVETRPSLNGPPTWTKQGGDYVMSL
eukprot:TRINITY_DN6208_c0_g2_i1.p1 TRINITY_DN6208_c0_g2~~TRINITY_DN6208_c0_g2_i1.p1  ORF type:complete len:245 (+),score=28.00 TRINITY_DN6208_c0_g2_i1:65-799(+)